MMYQNITYVKHESSFVAKRLIVSSFKTKEKDQMTGIVPKEIKHERTKVQICGKREGCYFILLLFLIQSFFQRFVW